MASRYDPSQHSNYDVERKVSSLQANSCKLLCHAPTLRPGSLLAAPQALTT